MMSVLAERYPEIRSPFEEASRALGYDLWELVAEGPAEQLNATEFAQPAMLVSDVALWRVWQSQKNPQAVVMAGHSLGEYAALVCAGSLGFVDAVQLVRLRGRYMQQAVKEGEGGMAAIIGLDETEVADICETVTGSGAEGRVSVANLNSPVQTVIAGNTALVDYAADLARERGAKRAVKLPVSVPSHCSLMLPASERLQNALSDITIRKPDVPVIQNVDAEIHEDPEMIRENLVRQMYLPVRWVQSVERFSEFGPEGVVECGPGKVLTGLIKRMVSGMSVSAIDTLLQ
ncbi:MAG: [acyl-carrier-protein] S-malonyltransferase [Gammaproteobacteria bacterium]|nr:MAG: [acyl-carrier-protein] S-malonyltransferase [Gammaproteobacteria bacterium]